MRYSRSLTVLCCLCLVPSLGIARPAVRHLVDARLDLGSYSVRDDTLTTYAFTGPYVELWGGYSLQMHESHRLGAWFGAGATALWTRAGDPGIALRYDAGLNYEGRVWHDERSQLWIGSPLRFDHELLYPESWDDAHGYWLAAMMVGPSVRYTRWLEGYHALELRAEVGLLGVASRPPERRLNKQDELPLPSYHFNRLGQSPQFAWIGKVTLLRASLTWRPPPARKKRPPSRHLGQGFGYGVETRVSRASFPEPFTSWYAGLILSLGWVSK